MTTSADEPVVVYTLRDIVERIDRQLAGIDAKLDGKANQSDLEELARKVADLAAWRAKVVGFFLGASLVAGGSGAAIAKAIGVG